MDINDELSNGPALIRSCRTCMTEDSRYYQIYDYVDENHSIMEMIDAIVPQINITTDDIEFSTLICETCVNNLLVGYQFQQQCIAIDQEFRQQILAPPEEVLVVNAKEDLTMEDESMEETKIEVYNLNCTDEDVEAKEEEREEVEVHVEEETEEIREEQEEEDECTETILGEEDNELHQEEELLEASMKKLDEMDSSSENIDDDDNEITPEDIDENENTIMDCESTLPLKIIQVDRKKRYTCAVCGKQYDRVSRIEDHLERRHRYSIDDIKRWVEIVDGSGNVMKREKMRKDKEMQERRCEEKEYEKAMSKIIQIKEENEPDVQVGENSKETKDTNADPNPLSIIKIGGRKRFKCGDCGKIYDRIIRMREHLKNRHSYDMKDINNWYVLAENEMDLSDSKIKPEDGLYTCEECGKQFCEIYRLQRHSIVHSVFKKYGCEICKHRFVSKQNYRNHMKLHENADNETTTTTPPTPTVYKCPECAMVFGNRNSLSAHCKRHYTTTEKNFTCLECNREFISKKTLSEHIKRVHPNITYACEHCDRTFGLPDHLERHMGVHRDIKCKVCHKKFTTVQTLNDHMNLHTGECPYLCPECGKSFPFAGSLRQHLARHSLVNQFHCSQCGKGFKCKANLKKHMKSHLGKRHRRMGFAAADENNLQNDEQESEVEDGDDGGIEEQYNVTALEDDSW
ncbi:zinc finger protein 345 [Musca domestica]|uniref:Zinc finger protein 345 n=1 Tax=Musca domestica TaxID=7370 RepID=A0A9J7CNJ5_MUSDO|nr:zinc finger protein 345 [Musca domestica]